MEGANGRGVVYSDISLDVKIISEELNNFK